MLKNDIEVELRGRLSRAEYLRLKLFLGERGVFKEQKERILIDYSQGVAQRTKDIRLRVTNGVPEMILKIGNWGGNENRREISILGKPGEFDTMVQLFGHLGLTRGMLAVRSSHVYTYQGLEFALVEVPGHSYYFEVEKMVHDRENMEAVKQEIRTVCEELQLDLFDDQGFFAYIEELNREANEIFDFTSYQDGYFVKRFNLQPLV